MNYWEQVFRGNQGYYMDMDNPSRLKIIKHIKVGDSVLDLGCGGGALRGLLPNNNYTGLDYSETAIKLAKERYGDVCFEIKDARQLGELAESSTDVVVMRHFLESQEDWKEIIRQAFRISSKKVIINMRRPLVSTPTRLLENPSDTWVWDINFDEFNMLCRQLSVNVTYGKVNEEELVIIGKHLDDVVFELDDQCPEKDAMPYLLKLKERFPELKVTLFCVPAWGSKEYFQSLKEKYGDWVELAVHGWSHDTEHGNATECNHWTREEAHKFLQMTEDYGCFVKGFRAPGWQLNRETVEVLAERGYWLADHWLAEQFLDIKLPRYTTNNLMEVHGHTWSCNMNGIEELATSKCNFGENTSFHFVSEQLDNNLIYLPQ